MCLTLLFLKDSNSIVRLDADTTKTHLIILRKNFVYFFLQVNLSSRPFRFNFAALQLFLFFLEDLLLLNFRGFETSKLES